MSSLIWNLNLIYIYPVYHPESPISPSTIFLAVWLSLRYHYKSIQTSGKDVGRRDHQNSCCFPIRMEFLRDWTITIRNHQETLEQHSPDRLQTPRQIDCPEACAGTTRMSVSQGRAFLVAKDGKSTCLGPFTSSMSKATPASLTKT